MHESMYDDETINLAREMDNIRLIIDLLRYSRRLEETVVELRTEINRLSPKERDIPYAELHSDIYENFDDHPAYKKYREYIEVFMKE